MNNKTLTVEEKEELLNLTQQEGFKGLLKVLDRLVFSKDRAVLQYDLVAGSPLGLALVRAEMDGARSIVRSFQGYIAQLKGDSVDGVRHRKTSNG